MSSTDTPPLWFKFSHHDRFRCANIVRRKWCRRRIRDNADIAGRTVYLDGRWITDIPSFYLSLGEAVNGTGGYFGGGLDALSDCLCGRFGVRPPLTIRLTHFEEVRAALDGRAWCRHHAEICRWYDSEDDDFSSLVDCGYFGDGSPEDIALWQGIYENALSDAPFDYDKYYGSYFDKLVDVLAHYRSVIVPADEEGEQVKETQ